MARKNIAFASVHMDESTSYALRYSPNGRGEIIFNQMLLRRTSLKNSENDLPKYLNEKWI